MAMSTSNTFSCIDKSKRKHKAVVEPCQRQLRKYSRVPQFKGNYMALTLITISFVIRNKWQNVCASVMKLYIIIYLPI